MRDGTGYVLDNSHVEAGQRFEVMSRDVEEPAEIDRHLDNVTSGRLDLTMPPLVTAAGRKPDRRSVH